MSEDVLKSDRTGFYVVAENLEFVVVCEQCGGEVNPRSTEWPELDCVVYPNAFARFGWIWANLGPNLMNHAAKCPAKSK